MSKYVEDEQFEKAMLEEMKGAEIKEIKNNITIGEIFAIYYNWAYLKITQLHNYTTSFRTFVSDLIFSYMRKA